MRLDMTIVGNVFSCVGEHVEVQAEREAFLKAIGFGAAEPASVSGVGYTEQEPDKAPGAIPETIGSEFTITLNNGDAVKMVVTDTGDDWIRVETRNCYGGYIPMTEMEKHMEFFVQQIPDDIKRLIVPAKRKHLDEKGRELDLSELLFLPAASEVFPNEMCRGDKGLYQQLEWYKTPQNRIRCLRDGDQVADWYWTGSRCAGTATVWCYVTGYGNADTSGATYTVIGAPVCFHIHKSK